jgi:hypothetical protein
MLGPEAKAQPWRCSLGSRFGPQARRKALPYGDLGIRTGAPARGSWPIRGCNSRASVSDSSDRDPTQHAHIPVVPCREAMGARHVFVDAMPAPNFGQIGTPAPLRKRGKPPHRQGGTLHVALGGPWIHQVDDGRERGQAVVTSDKREEGPANECSLTALREISPAALDEAPFPSTRAIAAASARYQQGRAAPWQDAVQLSLGAHPLAL